MVGLHECDECILNVLYKQMEDVWIIELELEGNDEYYEDSLEQDEPNVDFTTFLSWNKDNDFGLNWKWQVVKQV